MKSCTLQIESFRDHSNFRCNDRINQQQEPLPIYTIASTGMTQAERTLAHTFPVYQGDSNDYQALANANSISMATVLALQTGQIPVNQRLQPSLSLSIQPNARLSIQHGPTAPTNQISELSTLISGNPLLELQQTQLNSLQALFPMVGAYSSCPIHRFSKPALHESHSPSSLQLIAARSIAQEEDSGRPQLTNSPLSLCQQPGFGACPFVPAIPTSNSTLLPPFLNLSAIFQGL